MLGTITADIDIEKLNERGKLECHLARSYTLPYEVSAFIYINVLVGVRVVFLPDCFLVLFLLIYRGVGAFLK